MRSLLKSTLLVASLSAVPGLAARPEGTSICDYYSAAVFNVSNATTQNTLLTLVVNTAIIGNYHNGTMGNLAGPGILAKDATYNNTKVKGLLLFSRLGQDAQVLMKRKNVASAGGSVRPATR